MPPDSNLDANIGGFPSPRSSIHTLPDDVLLEIFDFYRLDNLYLWNHQLWHKLAHTCRRWRHIIFSSCCRLDLQLYCTYDTPITDMLNHSLPVPLVVNYGGQRPLSAEDEEGALIALQQHDRVCFIDLQASIPTLGKLFAVMDGPFPMLESLALTAQYDDDDEDNEDNDDIDNDRHNCPRLPQTFQAPNLRHLELVRVGDVVEPQLPLLASLSGLVTLALMGIPVSLYLPVEYLVSSLSLMPQLEHLCLQFTFYIPSDDIEGELVDSQSASRILLPSLNDFSFKGDSTYLEGLAARICAPLLTTFSAEFLTHPSSTLPRLSELLSVAEELKFPAASIMFSGSRVEDPSVTICMARSEGCLDRSPEFAPFQLGFLCEMLDVQVTRAGQICNALAPMLQVVERLHLDFHGWRLNWQPEPQDEIHPTQWHNLLRPFQNVEKLQIDARLMEDLSIALYVEDDESSTEEILPKLSKLTRPDDVSFGDSFERFIAARQARGQLIVKRRRLPIPYSDSEDEEEEEQENEEEEGQGQVKSNGKGKGNSDGDEDATTDRDAGLGDEDEVTTELDSDSDFDSDFE